MRRSYTRKRNRIHLKDINKKALLSIVIITICLILLISVYVYFIQNHVIKTTLENDSVTFSSMNENSAFSLEKITIFSSATAVPNGVSNSVWNLDLSQYSDIAINLKCVSNNDDQPSIQRVYVDHVETSNTEYGTPLLYQKSLQDFGKCTFSEELIEKDLIEFSVVPNATKETSAHIVDNQLSLPIVLGYYNKDIKKNFLDSDYTLEYNGKLLKKASIPPSSIRCNLSFDIHIVTEKEEEYICNVSIDIPLENSSSSIYDAGNITQELTNLDNYKFLRIK